MDSDIFENLKLNVIYTIDFPGAIQSWFEFATAQQEMTARGPVRGVVHVLRLNFKAWYVAISGGSRVVVGISTRRQSLVTIS